MSSFPSANSHYPRCFTSQTSPKCRTLLTHTHPIWRSRAMSNKSVITELSAPRSCGLVDLVHRLLRCAAYFILRSRNSSSIVASLRCFTYHDTFATVNVHHHSSSKTAVIFISGFTNHGKVFLLPCIIKSFSVSVARRIFHASDLYLCRVFLHQSISHIADVSET